MRILLVALAMCLCVVGHAPAQSMSEAEKQIREIIAQSEKGKPLPFTTDRIYWSGHYRQPVVGNEKPEEIPGEHQPAARVEGSFRSKIEPVRIEVAKSGDLAYEFSTSENSFDLKTGKRVTVTASALRVWRKEGGQWKIAALFARPHVQDEKAP